MAIKIKNEDFFRRMYELDLARSTMTPTEDGRRQFFEHQSRGIRPVAPDAYYAQLSEGKWGCDWLSREIALERWNGMSGPAQVGWQGWDILVHDWRDDLDLLAFITNGRSREYEHLLEETE